MAFSHKPRLQRPCAIGVADAIARLLRPEIPEAGLALVDMIAFGASVAHGLATHRRMRENAHRTRFLPLGVNCTANPPGCAAGRTRRLCARLRRIDVKQSLPMSSIMPDGSGKANGDRRSHRLPVGAVFGVRIGAVERLGLCAPVPPHPFACRPDPDQPVKALAA